MAEARACRCLPIALLAVWLWTTACGTRVDSPAAAVSPSAFSGFVPAAGTGVVGDTGAVTTPTSSWSLQPSDDGSPGLHATSPPGAGHPAPGTRDAARSSGPGTIPAPNNAGGAVKAEPSKSARPVTAAPPRHGLGGLTPEVPADPSQLPPVVIASVGTLSGPVGATVASVAKGAQLWVKHINQKGGLNGHQVNLVLFDDGGDSARHRSQVQEAIERHKAIAFLANVEVVTGHASIEYITSKRVPVVGSDTANEYFYNTSPMYFPQASHGELMVLSAIAGPGGLLIPEGKTKLGTLACVEAEVCRAANPIWEKFAKRIGWDLVYQTNASLGQPDFTAQCLAARNAGVQFFMAAIDPNSMDRIIASCLRQGYHPVFGELQAMAADSQKGDPKFEGIVATSNVFPYFQSGTPATDEFQEAMRTLGRDTAKPGVGLAQGWVAGKLLEKAATHLPEPPTSAAILAGLWSIRDDTLGGLTNPITFMQDQPAKPQGCWYDMTIRNGQWKAPNGFRLNCWRG